MDDIRQQFLPGMDDLVTVHQRRHIEQLTSLCRKRVEINRRLTEGVKIFVKLYGDPWDLPSLRSSLEELDVSGMSEVSVIERKLVEILETKKPSQREGA